MEKFKKIFAAGVIFVTVLSMSAVTVPDVKAAASAGDLVKISGSTTVYYLGADGKRYIFPNEPTFFSWYKDFSGVVTITQTELENFPRGANVTIRPGTKLIKTPDERTVYAVESSGKLRSIVSEDNAKLLWGNDWAKRVVDVAPGFMTNYTTGTALTAGAYPTGSLVKFGTSADTYYVNADGTVSKFATDAALTANRFKTTDVVTATITKPAAGADITAAVGTLTDTSSGAGGVVGAGTGLTVALASDTPASATVITDTTATTGNGQANVKLVKVNFTAAADGDVKVKNIKFKRSGISADTDMDNLYLYDGDTRLTDGSAISSNYVTFNNASGLFTVAKGTTKSITLVGDMAFGATSGKTIGFNLVAATDVTTDGAAVSGTFPATGNLMSTANATDLGKITFSGYASYPTNAATDISPALDQEVFRFTMASTNQELKVEKLKLTAVGSLQLTDLKNFKLTVSGTQVGPTVAAMATGNIIEFDMSAAPLVITKGGTKTISLRADIVSGSTRTFYWSFQNQQDITVKDASYNVYIEPYAAGTFAVIKPTGSYTISAGSLSVSKSSSSPTTAVAVDATGQTLAIYDFTAAGEDAKVQNLNVKANITAGTGGHGDGGILNGKVLVDDVQVGTTKNLTDATAVNFTFGSTFIVKAGTTAKVKIVGDIKTTTSTSFSGGESVLVTLTTGSSNVQTLTSLNTLNRPATDTDANSINITSAALSATKYSGFGSRTVAAGTNDARLASFVVGAGASEGVAVSSITVVLTSNNSNSATISRMYLKDNATGAVLGSVKSSISASNVYTVSFNLAASGGKVVDLYGDIKSSANVGSWIASIGVDGTGISTSKAVSGGSTTEAGNNMQTITIGSGSLSATNGSMPDAAIVLAGSTGNNMAQFTFSAANEGFTIDQLKLKVPNGFATSASSITVKYKDKVGAAQQANAVFVTGAESNATATFTNLTIYVPSNSDASIDVYVDLAAIADGATSGAVGTVALDYNEGFNAIKDSGGSPTTSVGTADLTSNSFYVRKSKPTFVKLALSGAPSTGNDLFKFTVKADNAGNIQIKQLGFTVTTNGMDVASLYLYDVNSGTQLTDTAVSPATTGGSVKLVMGRAAGNDGSLSDDDLLTIGSADSPVKTYSVRGTISNYTAADSDSMTIKFAQDTTATSTASATTIIAQNNFNVWSDRSAATHATTSAEWTGGYLLKDMSQLQQLP